MSSLEKDNPLVDDTCLKDRVSRYIDANSLPLKADEVLHYLKGGILPKFKREAIDQHASVFLDGFVKSKRAVVIEAGKSVGNLVSEFNEMLLQVLSQVGMRERSSDIVGECNYHESADEKNVTAALSDLVASEEVKRAIVSVYGRSSKNVLDFLEGKCDHDPKWAANASELLLAIDSTRVNYPWREGHRFASATQFYIVALQAIYETLQSGEVKAQTILAKDVNPDRSGINTDDKLTPSQKATLKLSKVITKALGLSENLSIVFSRLALSQTNAEGSTESDDLESSSSAYFIPRIWDLAGNFACKIKPEKDSRFAQVMARFPLDLEKPMSELYGKQCVRDITALLVAEKTAESLEITPDALYAIADQLYRQDTIDLSSHYILDTGSLSFSDSIHLALNTVPEFKQRSFKTCLGIRSDKSRVLTVRADAGNCSGDKTKTKISISLA